MLEHFVRIDIDPKLILILKSGCFSIDSFTYQKEQIRTQCYYHWI